MLELRNISFEVADESGNKQTILKDINLEINDRTFVVITGPNGGGKSTLAKIIMGIETPTTGRIFFQGEDISDLSITDRAKKGIAYAFQQPVHFKGLTVHELLSFSTGKNLDFETACEYLSAVGLCARDYIHREIGKSLSGGELKRIEIAIAIARNAHLTLFDEPEAGIDLWSFNHLIQVFERIRQQTNGSLLIISHQERILDIADKIVVIANGTVAEEGSKHQILPNLLHDFTACGLMHGKEAQA